MGSIEPQFYALLVEKAGLDAEDFAAQHDQSRWPELKAKLGAVFKTKTRAQWCDIMEGSDVCFAPVLGLSEVADHPHNKARATFVEMDGLVQPAPSPRFSRTEVSLSHSSRLPGEDSRAVLQQAGLGDAEIDKLVSENVIFIPEAEQA